MAAALKVPKTQADALGFDLAAAVAAYSAALSAHAETINQPAPSSHPLVEEIVRRHNGAFLIVEDRPPSDHRYALMRSVVMDAQERVNRVLSPARQKLAMMDVQILSQKAERTPAENGTLSQATAALGAITAIQRHAALLSVEVDELPPDQLATWAPHGWPAV